MEKAMSMSKSHYRFEVQWHPFLLRPSMPMEGVAKASNTPDNPRVGARLKMAGESVGVNFTGACDRYPNTQRAHLLTELAAKSGHKVLDGVVERLFHAYFTAGDDINSVDVLCKIAREAGLQHDNLAEELVRPAGMAAVRQTALGWGEKGITGVPYFFFNGKPGFSGGHPPKNFLRAFEEFSTADPLAEAQAEKRDASGRAEEAS